MNKLKKYIIKKLILKRKERENEIFKELEFYTSKPRPIFTSFTGEKIEMTVESIFEDALNKLRDNYEKNQ